MVRGFIVLILILFSIALVSAQNITLNYPGEVEANQEFSFSVLLSDFDPGSYDLKIDLLDSNGTRVAKILNNGEWKSTYYYITNAISNNENKEFRLKIESYVGISNIVIKVRATGTSNVVGTFENYSIESLPAAILPEENPPADSAGEPEPETGEEPEREEEDDDTPIPAAQISNASGNTGEVAEEEKPVTAEVIYLTPESKDIKTNENVLTSDNLAIYGLIGFCALLGALFTIKRIKKPKTEFKEELKTI